MDHAPLPQPCTAMAITQASETHDGLFRLKKSMMEPIFMAQRLGIWCLFCWRETVICGVRAIGS